MNAPVSAATRPLADRLASLKPSDPNYAPRAVESLLAEAIDLQASDVHLLPGDGGLELIYRVDGVLRPAAVFPAELAPNLVARLKVLADLLTYRSDVPQEGRIRFEGRDVELRLSTFPTLHGEKAVVRVFGGAGRYQRLADLGLPEEVARPLGRLLGETSGSILVTGPAGSGKTTTLYAALREIAATGSVPRSLVSLEDPVEVAVPGVAQTQVQPSQGFDLGTALRFVLRQDPEVIMVGEIRDRATAEASFQASLTGHLVLSTFHAGSAAEAVGRLSDMGIEPYILRSSLLAVLNQRLFRRLCRCSRESDAPADALGLPVAPVRVAVGCQQCRGTGYRGRLLVVEMLTVDRSELGRAILSRGDTAKLERLAREAGMVDRWQRACDVLRAGETDPAEVRRVLGWSAHHPPADRPILP